MGTLEGGYLLGLVWYMVSTINDDIGTILPTHGYHNCIIDQMLIIDGYVQMRKSLHTRVIRMSIHSSHIDAWANLLRYEDSHMVYRPNWHQKQYNVYYLDPIGDSKMRTLHFGYSIGINKNEETIPILEAT